jgi:hypothetical protein
MNTTLDESVVARWLDDELQGAELAAFEASIQGDAELLARREEVRDWRATVAAVMPAVIEPPYPEFFNSRIERAILAQGTLALPAKAASWRGWWLPAAAVAGMVLSFWVGTKTGGTPQVVVVPSQNPSPAQGGVGQPTVYTPERGVDAEWFSSTDASATVIVLEGVEAIPDNLDFAGSAGLRSKHESTAGVEESEHGEIQQ